jgi:hypothetical protein
MMEERTAQGAEPDDDGVEAPRAFPVPRNRPVLVPADEEEECEEHEGSWHGRALLYSALVAIAALGLFAWVATRTDEPPLEAEAPLVEVRSPTSDPAVETYYTPSAPEVLPPLAEEAPPLPVAPVSLDEVFGRDGPQ